MQTLEAGTVSGFPEEIERAMHDVRIACRAVIDAACGGNARAKDVSSRLGVHAKLGWQLWNVAHAPTFGAVKFLPNAHGVRIICEAAEREGVDAQLLRGLSESIESLQRAIETHAGDRESFEMLLDAQTDDESEIKWRKQAFLGNSFIFGARAKTMLVTAILYPEGEKDAFGIVRLHGLLDLVRTRAGVRWPFASLVVQQPTGVSALPEREPLDFEAGEIPLLTRFCSQPLPSLQRERVGDLLIDEVVPGPVGLTGATTIFTGEIIRNLGFARGTGPGQHGYFGSGVRTPSEVVIADHIVHKTIFPGVQRELRVYSELLSQTSRDERDRLQVSERLQSLGNGLRRIQIADVPNYLEVLKFAFLRLNMDPSEFEVFRVVMKYPPMPASLMVRHELPFDS